jgi:hypothetical protein
MGAPVRTTSARNAVPPICSGHIDRSIAALDPQQFTFQADTSPQTPTLLPKLRLSQGGLMTNRELLQSSEQVLKELDRQRLFLLRVEGTPMPCPACKHAVNVFDAAGIDLDAYEFGKSQYAFRCPSCSAELDQVVPFVAGGPHLWHWQLEGAWLQEQLRKAKAFDQRSQSDTSSQKA